MPSSLGSRPVSELEVPKPRERYDERDAMFSRAALVPGTPSYQAAYARRPDLKEVDDGLRSLPQLTEPGGTFYDEAVMEETDRYFRGIEDLSIDEEWRQRNMEAFQTASDPSAFFKRAALELGAVAAGWAPLEPAFIYSHKGRLPEDFGREVNLDHPRVLVFLVEMTFEEMQMAPRAPSLRESARQYFRAAHISLHLEALLQGLGFKAKQHYDGHYDVILPPLAVLAGLGEMGRNNILIADRYGSRVRIGCITTDFPSRVDVPRSLGADAFCKICKKCAENCPSRALSLDDKVDVLGTLKWTTQVERCYRYWRQVGTDCGVCMASCPFSHRNNALHNFVRWMVRCLPFAHRALVWADTVVYGRKWRPANPLHPSKGAKRFNFQGFSEP